MPDLYLPKPQEQTHCKEALPLTRACLPDCLTPDPATLSPAKSICTLTEPHTFA